MKFYLYMFIYIKRIKELIKKFIISKKVLEIYLWVVLSVYVKPTYYLFLNL